ncbi:FadR/GntR family transcriptional regulator [Paenibacillus yanchengensis]|uniref:FadR/GntR family transcriptional regulator n=1 Tax=Paenibacillus yanchengensis TaxID=2035833 RepID=A0ABW4YMA2_9BACL
MLKHTEKQSLVEQAAKQMQQLIETGKWMVGNKIPAEPELMEQLQISRNTLREAIRALVHAGLMKTRQGDGTYVIATNVLATALQRRINQTSLLHTIEIRHALEREAAHLAAERRTDEDLHRINSCLIACQEASDQRKKADFILADLQLHQAIISSAHNPLLEELYTHISEIITDSITDFIEFASDEPYLLESHIRLVDAIISQDSETAVREVHCFIISYKNLIINGALNKQYE